MTIAAPSIFVALHIDWQRVMRLSMAEVTEGLPAERVARIANMRRLEDRHRSAFAGHLISFFYRQLRPGRPLPGLIEGPHGKPAFADPAAPEFNISHSGDWVVGISGRGPLGIDVEVVRPETEVLDDILCPAELRDIQSIPASRRVRRFVQLWTLKEARLKAQGLGLVAGAPERLSFRLDNETAILAGDTSSLVHRCILLDTLHACATCTPPPGPPELSLIDAIDILAARNMTQ
jgi:phosphopantetheinyl transferase